MAIASDFRIAGNDEHGMNPPTVGKRTPVMPYINRPFYENEFNAPTKNYFLANAARVGFLTFDAKPEEQDIAVSTRVSRVNASDSSLLVTFAYNATQNENFNSWGGLEVFYSSSNAQPVRSHQLADTVYTFASQNGYISGNTVRDISEIGVLSSVQIPSTLVEGGFMTNFYEAKLMMDPDYQNLIAEQSLRGVCHYLSVPYRSSQATVYPVLRLGSRGSAVTLLQYRLRNYQYDVTADGIFGTKTDTAVRLFQTQNALTTDGIVGAATWSKINNFQPQSTVLRQGARGVETFYLQQKLLSKLYPVGTIDGVFGANTNAQVQAFQLENGLTVDGVVGPATWERVRVIGGGRPLR